jgi:PhnB protein
METGSVGSGLSGAGQSMSGELAVPMLVCRDAAAEVSFCVSAFGAAEISRRSTADGNVLHAALKIGDTMIMVHGETAHLASRAPALDGTSPVVIFLYLANVDAALQKAVAAGARILLPAADQAWGDRVGRIIDPAGHVWNIASRSAQKATSGTKS